MTFDLKYMIRIIKKTAPVICLLVVLLSACSKDKYFYDTGVHKAKFDGSILQYLRSKPMYFDTLVKVINVAGMNDVFEKENITFFAPPSSSIYKTVKRLNNYLRTNGQDTVAQLEQVKPEVWREMLSLYIFKGTSRLKDYPQLDTTAIVAFPGQGYTSYGENGRTMNIGVFYQDAGGVKYAGYRQLILSFIPDFSKPKEMLVNIPVASSDIAPDNGIVHVLQYQNHNFGFDTERFILTAASNGIGPAQ